MKAGAHSADRDPEPERERQHALFVLAAAKRGAERGAFLDHECAGDGVLRERLESLLAAHDQASATVDESDTLVTRTEPLSATNPENEGVGQTIGRYKLLEKIGEGGWGVVYIAEQSEPVRRRVALKVIKLGMDTKAVVARFEAERQALAMMDHPNIAKVFDAGMVGEETGDRSQKSAGHASPAGQASGRNLLTSDSQLLTPGHGRPYFVMELVRGIRITDYCDQNQLSTKERVELFARVCQAIQHAHQKGIIHRDIKPSNILVTLHDGIPVPKVIDFGIAKATQGRLTDATVYTQLHQLIGTPAYMSPEQAEMSGLDIDTRSDIYSLGVLLYELLTGQTPFNAEELVKAGLQAICRKIRDVEPQRPSTKLSTLQDDELTATAKRHGTQGLHLVKLVRGDLDWIVMKCLEKDRTRRYETANGLAMDLERHLENEPVVARPPSTAYRLQKAWHRHRMAFAGSVLIAGILIVATGVSTWQAVRAKRAERLAEQRLADSEAISKFLAEVFQSPNPERDGRSITVVETLNAAARKLKSDLATQPAARAKLQATLASTYLGLGLFREAIELGEDVRDYYLATFGAEHLETFVAILNLANAYSVAGRQNEALALHEQVLPLLRKVLGPEHPDTIQGMSMLAIAYGEAGRFEEAVVVAEQAVAACRQTLDPNHPLTMLSVSWLANSLSETGRKEEALELHKQVLPLYLKLLGPEHSDTIAVAHNLGFYHAEAGDFEEAVQIGEQTLAVCRKALDPQHPLTLGTTRLLADNYFVTDRQKEALDLTAHLYQLQPRDADSLIRLAVWQAWLGHDDSYEDLRRQLLDQAEDTTNPNEADCAAKAYCLRPSNDAAYLAKALRVAHKSVEVGANSNDMPWFKLAVGLAEHRNGHYALADEALKATEQAAGIDPGFRDARGLARLFRAMNLARENQLEEARLLFSQVHAEMPPPPLDRRRPLANGKLPGHDVLLFWLVREEARDLIGGHGTPSLNRAPLSCKPLIPMLKRPVSYLYANGHGAVPVVQCPARFNRNRIERAAERALNRHHTLSDISL